MSFAFRGQVEFLTIFCAEWLYVSNALFIVNLILGGPKRAAWGFQLTTLVKRALVYRSAKLLVKNSSYPIVWRITSAWPQLMIVSFRCCLPVGGDVRLYHSPLNSVGCVQSARCTFHCRWARVCISPARMFPCASANVIKFYNAFMCLRAYVCGLLQLDNTRMRSDMAWELVAIVNILCIMRACIWSHSLVLTHGNSLFPNEHCTTEW